MEKKTQLNLWFAAAAFAALLLFQFVTATTTYEPIPYSQFQTYLKDGKIEEVFIHQDRIEGKLKAPLENGKINFITQRVEPELASDLAKYNVKFRGTTDSNFISTLLSWIVPTLASSGSGPSSSATSPRSRALAGMMSIGKSRAKIYVEKETGVTFADIAGVEEAKAELKEIVDFLKNPEDYGRLGAGSRRASCSWGRLAPARRCWHALLQARRVCLLLDHLAPSSSRCSSASAQPVFATYSSRRARQAPCIIFIDELDSLGRVRSAGGFGSNDEKEQTLNQLLAELDGFDPSVGIVLLAATNRPEILDPALTRAGRFDRQVASTARKRRAAPPFSKCTCARSSRPPDLDVDQIAAITPGFSGADLANLVNEAALTATRRHGTEVTMDDFTRAVERLVAGIEKRSRLLNPEERRIVAYHEMGHALVASALKGTDPVHKVSIIPRALARSATRCSAPPTTAS